LKSSLIVCRVEYVTMNPLCLATIGPLAVPVIWPIAINDVTRSASDDDIGPRNLDWVKRFAIIRGKVLIGLEISL
jgi:hypothetical protein